MFVIRLALRELLSRRGRNLLTLGGIGVGVTLVVGVSLVNRSITQTFSEMVDALAGQAGLEVYGGDVGFPEDLLEVVRSEARVEHAAPLVVGNVFVDDDSGASLAIVGVDILEEEGVRRYEVAGADGMPIEDPLVFLNSPDSLLVTEEFARRRSLKVGNRLDVLTPVGKRRLTVRGALQPEGVARALGESLGVMDIFAAQFLFGKEGKFDRISIVLKDGYEPDDLAGSLRKRLPPGVSLQRPEQRRAEMESLLAALRLTLSMVGICALALGLCMVYSTMSTVVALRQRELGVLRALGSRRRDVLRLILAEASLLGLVGSALGLALGFWLARILLAVLGEPTEASAAVSFGRASVSGLTLSELLKASTGVGAALVAGWVPARRASRVPVVNVLRAGLSERLAASAPGYSALARVGLVILSGTLIAVGVAVRSPVLIVGGTVLFAIAFISVAVSGVAVLAGKSQELLKLLFGVQGTVVAASLARNPRRTALTAAILAGGIALHIVIATGHHSVKGSVLTSLSQGVRENDLIVFSALLTGGHLTSPIDGSVAASLQALAGVEAVVMRRGVYQPFRDSRVLVQAYSEILFADARYSNRWIFAEGDPERALQAVAENGAALVSHNFAFHFGVGPGDTVRLDTPGGKVTLPVAGVVVNYDNNAGTLMLSRRTYLQWFQDPLVNEFRLAMAPEVDPQVVKAQILQEFRESYRLRVLRGGELLDYIAGNINRSHRFELALEAVVLLVVLLSLADTLMVSVLGRTREIGVLRAAGAQRNDVLRMVVLEGLVISTLAAAIGIPGGILMAIVWMQVHFTYVFGWIIDFRFSPVSLVTAVGMIFLVTIVAAAYPARRASRLPVVESVAYE